MNGHDATIQPIVPHTRTSPNSRWASLRCVKAMLLVGGDLVVNQPDQSVVAKRETFGELSALVIGSEAQPTLRSKGDDHRIDWGYLYLTAPGAAGAHPAAPAGPAAPATVAVLISLVSVCRSIVTYRRQPIR